MRFAADRRPSLRAGLRATAWLALCLISLAPAIAAPTWRNIGPGGGGWIPCLAVSPHDSRVLYAGCDVGGFYKSTDAGATWRILNTGLHDHYVEVIAPHPRDPRVIYLGTEGGVHKSTDGGETWQWQRQGFPPANRYAFTAPIGALAIDPQNPEVVYAGIGRPRWRKSGQGTVYRTTDGGAHWQIANPGGGGMDREAVLSDLVVHPGDSKRLYAATNRGLYRSDDAGATWRRLQNGLPHANVHRVALCRDHPETLYAALRATPAAQPWQGGVYRSDDGGETWTPRLNGLGSRVGKPGEARQMTSNIERLAVHPTNPDIAYAGDEAWVTAGLYRTTDGGNSWRKVTDQRANMEYGWITMWGPSVMGLAMDPQAPDTLYFSTSGHLFRTTDRGERWTAAYTRRVEHPAGAPESPSGYWAGTGLEVTCANSFAIHPRDPKRLFFSYMDIGLLQSFDGGRTMTQTVQGMTNRGNTFRVAFDPDNPDLVFAGTGEWGRNHGDVCRSEDGGLTWKVVGKPDTGLPNGQTRHLIVDRDSPATARRVYVSVSGAGIFCSEDGGNSWQSRSQGLHKGEVRGLEQHPRNPKVLYALLAGSKEGPGGLYRTEDRGHTWARVGATDFPDPKALVLCPSDPSRLYVATRERGTAQGITHRGGVYHSRDGGATWTHVLEDPFMQALAVDPRNADVVYAGGNDHPFHDEALGRGVLRSRDGGRTWQSLNEPALTSTKIVCLTVDPHNPSRLYMGTGGNSFFVREE